MEKLKITAQQYIDMIRECHGMVTNVAKRLNISRTTVNRVISKNAKIAAALQDAREERLDFAESMLDSNISNGDVASIIFYLKTQGKNRGYVEKQQIDLDVKTVVKLTPRQK